jgi:hypothetical protein
MEKDLDKSGECIFITHQKKWDIMQSRQNPRQRPKNVKSSLKYVSTIRRGSIYYQVAPDKNLEDIWFETWLETSYSEAFHGFTQYF